MNHHGQTKNHDNHHNESVFMKENVSVILVLEMVSLIYKKLRNTHFNLLKHLCIHIFKHKNVSD